MTTTMMTVMMVRKAVPCWSCMGTLMMMITMMITVMMMMMMMILMIMIILMIMVTREEGSTLLELCGDLASPVTVQSYSHQLEVTK